MSKLNRRTFLKCIYRRMARLERAVLSLLCIFAVKFVFSTAAPFAAPLQPVDMLGSGRNPVDVWLLLLCCTAVLGTDVYKRQVLDDVDDLAEYIRDSDGLNVKAPTVRPRATEHIDDYEYKIRFTSVVKCFHNNTRLGIRVYS